jgi:hypothetical protein
MRRNSKNAPRRAITTADEREIDRARHRLGQRQPRILPNPPQPAINRRHRHAL